MTRQQALKNLRTILLNRREALRRTLAGDSSMLKDLGQPTSGDVVDYALDTAHEEISSQLAEVESRELVRIENALARMANGTYGRCEGCSCSIPLARLQALPYATFCIKCQRELERGPRDSSGRADWGRSYDNPPLEDLRLGDFDVNVS
jgi:DnaK suppressor protein